MKLISIVFLVLLVATGCRTTPSAQSTHPDSRVHMVIVNESGKHVLEFRLTPDLRVAECRTTRGSAWGTPAPHHLGEGATKSAWADARAVFAAVPEGAYFFNDHTHLLTIALDGQSKAYSMTRDEAKPRPPKQLERLTRFMSATTEW